MFRAARYWREHNRFDGDVLWPEAGCFLEVMVDAQGIEPWKIPIGLASAGAAGGLSHDFRRTVKGEGAWVAG
jgi:hypothetical protein